MHQAGARNTPDEDEQIVRLGRLGDHLLLAWQSQAGPTWLQRLTASGQKFGEVLTVYQPLSSGDELVALPTGEVAWLAADDGAREMRLVRMGPP